MIKDAASFSFSRGCQALFWNSRLFTCLSLFFCKEKSWYSLSHIHLMWMMERRKLWLVRQSYCKEKTATAACKIIKLLAFFFSTSIEVFIIFNDFCHCIVLGRICFPDAWHYIHTNINTIGCGQMWVWWWQHNSVSDMYKLCVPAKRFEFEMNKGVKEKG